jgi:Zn finger protein HypA/HybF involved in hydrogenase expression
MADRLITIANFDEPLEANLAKIKLESEGIKCFLAGENFVATYWLLSTADRGIKLQVKESEAKRALEILKTKEDQRLEKDKEKDLTAETYDLLCPKCHSENIEYEKFSRKVSFLSILFFRFPLPILKKKYKCKNCGYVWK